MKNNKGFTLIEILVVVAIIAILSAVVISNMGEFSKRGRDAKRKENIDQITKAINLYFNENGHLPGNLTGWCTYISNTSGGYGTAFQSALAPHMKVIPFDPTKRGQVGDYLFNNVNNSIGKYELCAILEDSTGNSYDKTSCLNGTVYNYCVTQ